MRSKKSKRSKRKATTRAKASRPPEDELLDAPFEPSADVPIEESVDAWVTSKQEEAETGPNVRLLAAKAKSLTEENHRLSKLLGLMESYQASQPKPPTWMSPVGKPPLGRATACLQFSDLHLDETVNPGEIGGLNAYSREIAELRLRRWANKACEMGERYKHLWDGAIVFWGGDMVSGSIHEELRETNASTLPESMVFWAPLLAAAIKQVADYYGHVHVPAIVGNHGRMTKEKSFKRRGRNSWDYLLAEMVRIHLKDDTRITFDLAVGSYLFVPIYDSNVYLTHGDECGGGSGWSGVWTPLQTIHRKGCEMASSHELRISYSVIGHWHQTVLAHHRGISCNGAMKGWDEFAAGLRLKPEAAMQNFFIHTPEHGVTIAGPLFLTDRKAEGW